MAAGITLIQNRIWEWIRSAGQTARGVVGELSDQNAYQRHLTAKGVSASAEEWRRFQDEHLAAKSKQGRCC